MVISFLALGLLRLPSFSSFGMAAIYGDSELPCIAGALAQLVQLDLAAAEMALLTVLSQPAMARAMGAAAARRARDLFAPEVVMAAHEALFAELEQCRRQAPADAHCRQTSKSSARSRACVCSLCISSLPSKNKPLLIQLPDFALVGSAAALSPMANSGAIAAGYRAQSTGERPCLQTSVAVVRLSGGHPMTKLSFWTRLRHLLIASRWQRWLFPNDMHHSLLDDSGLAADPWA